MKCVNGERRGQCWESGVATDEEENKEKKRQKIGKDGSRIQRE